MPLSPQWAPLYLGTGSVPWEMHEREGVLGLRLWGEGEGLSWARTPARAISLSSGSIYEAPAVTCMPRSGLQVNAVSVLRGSQSS